MTKREKWLLAGPDDIRENVQALAMNEIYNVIFGMKEATAEMRMERIRGIMNLMTAVDKDLDDVMKAEADHD